MFTLLLSSVNTTRYFQYANLAAYFDNGIITITSQKSHEENAAETFIGELIDAVKQTDSGTTRQPLLSGTSLFGASTGLRAAMPEHALPTVIGTLQTIGTKVEFDSNGLTPEERKKVLRGTGAYKMVGTKVEIIFSDESDACSTEAEIRDRLEDLLDTKAKEKGSKNLIRPGYT